MRLFNGRDTIRLEICAVQSLGSQFRHVFELALSVSPEIFRKIIVLVRLQNIPT